ncbi:ester cyclase, partial [Planctomycetota bacterium]
MFLHIKKIFVTCCIVVVLGTVLIAAPTEEELLEVHGLLMEAINTHDMNLWLSYCTENFAFDDVSQPPPMNKEETKAAFELSFFPAFPDFHATPSSVLVSGNILADQKTFTATHQGEYKGIPPTGKSIQIPVLDIFEFEGDKLKKVTVYMDAASMMIQLGLMPAPELDPALLVPSFPLPDAEPTGLTPLEAALENDALYDAHDVVNYAKRIHPDAELLLAPLGVPLNRSAFIAVLELYFLGFPDLNQDILRTIDMGDGWVAAEVVYKGTNNGPYFGIPATRRYSEVRGAWIARIDADGLMTNLSVYFDNITTLANLGLFPPPDPAANKALENRVFEEIWNQGLLDVADEVFAPDAILHLGTDDVQGPEGFKQYVAGYRAAIPDIHWTVEDQVAEGDIVVTRLTGTGTHQGELMGIPPTGLQVTATAIATVRIAEGKIQESWNSWDALGLMQQLGVMPPTYTDPTWGAPSEVTGDPGNPTTNTATVLYVVQKFWNEQNVTVLDSTHSLDSIAHNPIIPGHPLPFHIYKNACLLHLAA